MPLLILAVLVGLLAFIIIAMRKEKDIIGFYKAQNIFGRAYAYFTNVFLFDGIALVAGGIITAVAKTQSAMWIMIALGAVFLAIGVLMCLLVYKKCNGELKKRVIWDLIVAGWGFIGRVEFFILCIFFRTWFSLNEPTAYEVNGQTVYAFPGSNDLYDCHGCKVGVASDDYSKAIMR